jgi:hypothetical protein
MSSVCYATICLAAGLALTASAVAEVSDETETTRKARTLEKQVIDSLNASMTCKALNVPGLGNVYCMIQFRGLEIELADINNPGEGKIYVRALGKNQKITSLGRRCILVILDDPDLLVVSGLGTHIIVRDDGVLKGYYNNDLARITCM